MLLLTVLSIHLQQGILRYRAERLLADIRSLDLRKTSFEEAQTVFRDWSSSGHYDGECTQRHCTFEVALQDFVSNHLGVFTEHPWLLRAYMFLAGRPARILAGIGVQTGVVWGKSFDVYIEVPHTDAEGHTYEYTLIGEAQSVSRFDPPGSWPDLRLHPNYAVGRPGGCTACVMVYARFTPYTAPEDVQRLMQFDLSCLTRWKPCREQGDIMPAAWSQYLKEQALRDVAWGKRTCQPQLVELLGRDAENSAIVDVIANRTESGGDGEPYQVSTVRLVERLKRTAFWGIGANRELRVFDGTVALATVDTAAQVHPGTQFIILFAHRKYAGLGPNGPDIWLEECGAVPLTENNLALVRHGIDQDYRAAEPEQPQPL